MISASPTGHTNTSASQEHRAEAGSPAHSNMGLPTPNASPAAQSQAPSSPLSLNASPAKVSGTQGQPPSSPPSATSRRSFAMLNSLRYNVLSLVLLHCQCLCFLNHSDPLVPPVLSLTPRCSLAHHLMRSDLALKHIRRSVQGPRIISFPHRLTPYPHLESLETLRLCNQSLCKYVRLMRTIALQGSLTRLFLVKPKGAQHQRHS